MTPGKDFKQLVNAAMQLIRGRAPGVGQTIRIGGSEFRLLADRDELHGWIVVLMQEPQAIACNEILRTRYGLTDREIEVAHLLADRYTNKEIADRLRVSLSTAARHTEHVLRKLAVTNRRHVRKKLMNE